MADKRISELNTITGANTADGDLFVIVDVDASETKKITLGELEKALGERDFSFADDDKLVFGDGDDLQIYHDSATSTNKVVGSIDVTGTVTADKLTIDSGATNIGIAVSSTDANSTISFSDNTTTTAPQCGANGDDFRIITSNNPRVVVLSSGNVGIGTTSPNALLDLSDSGSTKIRITDTLGTGSYHEIQSSGPNGQNLVISSDVGGTGSGSIIIRNNGVSEAMRIDSSGTLLVGTTINDGQSIGAGTQDGTVIAGASQYIQRGDNANLWLSKPSGATNSEFVKFYDNSSLVGSISTQSSDLVISGSDTNHGGFRFASQAALPLSEGTLTDNFMDLGSGTWRYRNIHVAGGVNFDDKPTAVTGSVTSKTLDDYEEGTWTPTVFGSSTAGTSTYSVQVGTYTKIGRQVTCQASIGVSTSGGTGFLTFGGFPFTPIGYEFTGSIMSNNLNLDYVGANMTLYLSSNTSNGRIYHTLDDAGWDRQGYHAETMTIIYTITYFTDS